MEHGLNTSKGLDEVLGVGTDERLEKNIASGGILFNQKENCKCLGATFTADQKIEDEITYRLQKDKKYYQVIKYLLWDKGVQ